ncbi:cytochrome c oxidase subunit II [Methylobacterium soli]|uniref:cytochrome-c oxidase n=1 Tax=Methylobacterium soli TaxID=553447 RepID=A0A6L3SRT9_9HYPH|nr:cytochrome c oxidase subunit II [Methylobacterium soli]KAB1070263.1 cytochrome c oxidase subunit II [Methylobacterium soli]GJE45742.1 Alternative cytochrome c oxidase subunit 2 [Methylobacterium soli]
MALVLVLIALGSIAFHLLSPWWWTPIASNWDYIDTTLIITFWITGIAFAAIVLFVAYCVFRFRHRPGQQAAYEPESRRLEAWLIGLTALGVAAMLAPGLIVWGQFVRVPSHATEIEIVAQQWRWSFRLPGADKRLGAADIRHVSDENPLGLDPQDAAARDDVVVDGGDLHLPVGHPVKVLLRSIDVVHNFYVPEFRAKMDMIPGMITYFWFTPTRTGAFDALCNEVCGVSHYAMRGRVVVDAEPEYRTWLDQQKTFAQLASGPAGIRHAARLRADRGR